jgi:protocatechuate 3,4-dioxygenase beta subunit
MGRFIKAFHDAGVPLLVGTDTEVIGFPGRSALEEIQELVDAGLTRQQALTAATKNAGDFVAKTIPGEAPFGTVAVGQRADLILLSGNPLEDLQQLRQLEGVMVRGRWWTSAQIAEMRNALVPRYRQIKSEVAQFDRLIHQKNVPEAAKMFQSLRTTNPHEVFINQFVLQQALDRGVRDKRLQDALEFGKMNVELQPDNCAMHAQLGRVYRLLGDLAAAEKSLNRSLELCASNGVALEEMAELANSKPPPATDHRDSPTKFTPPPGAESGEVKELIGRAESALKSGKSVTDLLTDPAFLSVHEYPRFRTLMRQSAKAARATIVTPKEPGTPLVVVGQLVTRDGQPLKGALVYVYHTSARGWYSDRAAHVASVAGDEKHARLFGYMRTDGNGGFELHTIRPGGYPDADLPEHIHVELAWPNTDSVSVVTEIQFDDDPRLTPAWRKRSQQEGFYIAKVKKDSEGIQHVQAELKMP